MYQVNVSKIEQTLQYLEQTLGVIEPLLKQEHGPQSPIEKLALQRALHIALESIADTGNELIDGFIMRDPGSYEDIVEILRDETVIPDAASAALKDIVNARRDLVTHFIRMNDGRIFELLQRHYATLLQFPRQVREYLNKEL
ncbi:DUF86 domain-containing protein [Aneurinibacillus sp. Ricciae_BoGa-3]|uniref:DUF86 domain-containing protein n=1 Tax=Aneurinibacillus sp. Ricciae_BoGa-3 TaxID=3022697 RepID=UPI00234219A6|nr:DUF86 domain-containing protein [Aneurinibacillus sp. Ricciae_BoGa-3]WCK53787.1 DUF86 domain-containing protein [Aneurinibacillus sp. Ricciae_BoGa-3]